MLGGALSFLGCIALASVLREGLKVLQRYLVLGTCKQIERETTVKKIDQLIRVDCHAADGACATGWIASPC